MSNLSNCLSASGCDTNLGTCTPDASQFAQPCPFGPSSPVCQRWYLCNPSSPFYNVTACFPYLESTCCGITSLNIPATCQNIPNMNCSAGCADEVGWTTCPSSLVGGIWTSLALTGQPPVSPVWSFSLQSSTSGTLSRKYAPGVTPDAATVGYSFPLTVRCRGNFNGIFDIDLKFGGSYQGYLGRGTVITPGAQNSSQGYVYQSSPNLNVLLVDLTQCDSRPVSAVASGGVNLIQVPSTPVTTSGGTNCSSPLSLSLPGSYVGPVTRAFTLSPSITVAACASTSAFSFTYSWNVVSGTGVPYSFPSGSSSTLSIGKGILSPGNYTVTLTVTVKGVATLTATSTIFILALPPVAMISPFATLLQISVTQNFVLNASSSYDPNQLVGTVFT